MDSPDSRTRDLNVQELINRAFETVRLSTPFEPAQGALAPPARPAPQPAAVAPAPEGGAVIHYPGSGGK
jgi:hypothetical protein